MKKERIVFLFLTLFAIFSSYFLYTTILRYYQSAEAAYGLKFELTNLELEERGDQGEVTVTLKCTNPSPLTLKTFQIRYLLYLNGRFVKSDAMYRVFVLPPGETTMTFAGNIHKYPMEYVREAKSYGSMIWMLELEIVLDLPFRGLRLRSGTAEYWVME